MRAQRLGEVKKVAQGHPNSLTAEGMQEPVCLYPKHTLKNNNTLNQCLLNKKKIERMIISYF